jgi:hypothetical protein
LDADARDMGNVVSDADEPLHVKKDTLDSLSWQKRYD